jgi:hypothetical protein
MSLNMLIELCDAFDCSASDFICWVPKSRLPQLQDHAADRTLKWGHRLQMADLLSKAASEQAHGRSKGKAVRKSAGSTKVRAIDEETDIAHPAEQTVDRCCPFASITVNPTSLWS